MAYVRLPEFVGTSSSVICTRCVMDDTDPTISFDDQGMCSYCNHFDGMHNVLPRSDGYMELEQIKNEILSRKLKGSNYDCIVGLSGGLDSSFLLHICVKKMNLKPLVLHVDAGWNTYQAAENIKSMSNGLNLDLYTEVIEWEEMRAMQLSFLRAGIPHLDVPQDMAFFSALYKYAIKNNIKSVLTGANYATEVIREPEAWGAYPGNDPWFVKNIVKKFSGQKLKTFPMVNSLISRTIYRFVYGMKVYKPLNEISYSKAEAEKILVEQYAWRPFKHKHHESFFTRFLESYYLPLKFKVDRRKAHFSSLILMNQMSRSTALQQLETCALSEIEYREDFEFLADKLEISLNELTGIMEAAPKLVTDYPSYRRFMLIAAKLQNIISSEKRLYK